VGSRRELAAVLAGVPLFARCTKRSLGTIARHFETVTVPAGKTIVREGAPGDAFFVLLEGDAAIEVGGEQVSTVGPGTHFGELALLTAGPRNATVRSLSEVAVGVLGARMFRTLIREYADMSEQLLAGLAAELRDARNELRALREAARP
jgi:CRP-like cAMP-binding protein